MSGAREQRIVHIVVFRAESDQAADAAAAELETLVSLDTLEALTVERDLGLHPPAYDLALLTAHQDAEQLARFRQDPRHLSVVESLAALVPVRATVDLAVTDSLTSILNMICEQNRDNEAEQNRDQHA